MESKGDKVLYLFFNEPTRQWHFEEILKEAKIARSKADKWLKRFISDGSIKRVKEQGRMPYYMGAYDTPQYRSSKRIFGLKMLHESGLLSHLMSIEARCVILFGSFTRSDWFSGSDIDIFILGNPEELHVSEYELKLHREIQIFDCHDRKDLDIFSEGLLKNIISGIIIKGRLEFVNVHVSSKESG
jgi:predicted nucleotidyltransferase